MTIIHRLPDMVLVDHEVKVPLNYAQRARGLAWLES